jgi:hypothetical protein
MTRLPAQLDRLMPFAPATRTIRDAPKDSVPSHQLFCTQPSLRRCLYPPSVRSRGCYATHCAPPFQNVCAWACLREALQIGQETDSVAPLLFAVPVASLLLADQGQAEQAVELYALAWRFPAVSCSRWCQDVHGKQLAAVAAALDLWP